MASVLQGEQALTNVLVWDIMCIKMWYVLSAATASSKIKVIQLYIHAPEDENKFMQNIMLWNM